MDCDQYLMQYRAAWELYALSFWNINHTLFSALYLQSAIKLLSSFELILKWLFGPICIRLKVGLHSSPRLAQLLWPAFWYRTMLPCASTYQSNCLNTYTKIHNCAIWKSSSYTPGSITNLSSVWFHLCASEFMNLTDFQTRDPICGSERHIIKLF